jgi:hypothetical protein
MSDWSLINRSPKTCEYPRMVEIDLSVGDAANPQLVQLETTAAEKAVVQVQAGTPGDANVYIKYSKNGASFVLEKGVIMTFDGPRHPFWRPFYVWNEGTADSAKLVFWLSGTQDGPVI